jgi:hypothetical protein
MLELGTSGSVRGVHSDMHPYRDQHKCSPTVPLEWPFALGAPGA